MISPVLFTSEQPKKNKMALLGILSQNKVYLLFGLLVIQLVWYILRQLVTSVSVNIHHYSPPLRLIIVKYKEALPKRGMVFKLQVCKRVGISQVEVYYYN